MPCVWLNVCVVHTVAVHTMAVHVHMCMLWGVCVCFVFFFCLFFCIDLFVRSQVLVPYAACLPVRESTTLCACVGGLALAVTRVVLCAPSLSLPVPPTCLWRTCVVPGPDISVCQQREKQSAGNWRLIRRRGGGEGKGNTAINKQEEWGRGGNGQTGERKQNKKWRIGMKMRPVNEDLASVWGTELRGKACGGEMSVWVWCEEVKNNPVDTIPPVKSNPGAYSSGYLSRTPLPLSDNTCKKFLHLRRNCQQRE